MTRSNKAAILGLIRAIADQALDNGLPPGRERGKYEQLIKASDKEYRYVNADSYQKAEACRKVQEFSEQIGWEKSGKNHGTILSFLLGVLDEYDGVFSDRITEIMRELVEHLENRKQFAPACYWSGDHAADKLREVLG